MLMLQQELNTFQDHLPSLLEHNAGQFVVIRGALVCQVLPTYEDALNWAYVRFGLTPFFVKQIDTRVLMRRP
jgi:hypothetical protein